MSSKLGFILSMIFVSIFFAFCMDMVTIQYSYTMLDSKATIVSYRISQHGSLDNEFITNLENEFNVDFNCIGNCNPLFGDVVDYTLSTQITPLIVSEHAMTLSVTRSAVIGFYA